MPIEVALYDDDDDDDDDYYDDDNEDDDDEDDDIDDDEFPATYQFKVLEIGSGMKSNS